MYFDPGVSPAAPDYQTDLAPRNHGAKRSQLAGVTVAFLALRVQLYARVVGDIDPDVNVRAAAEIPDERRPFQSPVVPDAVVADARVLVEGQAAVIQTA